MHVPTTEAGAESAALGALIDPALAKELTAPRRLGETFADYRARLAARDDILADLVSESMAADFSDDHTATGITRPTRDQEVA